ncbi:MAG: transglutaminase domain-containing protein, partial [Bacteroidota bacterium]
SIKEEYYAPAFSDIAEQVHTSVTDSWDEVVQWYSDLSSQQAKPDYTIQRIADELLKGKQLSKDEQFRLIYDFVCKNIQYSSIDFRQSGFIPQKASDIYHSRLGDCKDVSTLFASIARAAGLKVNLVLINTANNGKNSVVLPSLNFNHCIVKAYTDSGSKYLELTDPNLPYGHLYFYHQGAPILEIPHEAPVAGRQLEYLSLNEGYKSHVIRNTTVNIQKDNRIRIRKDVVKTGTAAGGICDTYFNESEEKKKEIMRDAVAPDYKSSIS